MNRRPPWRHRRIVCSALLLTLLVACSRNASETSDAGAVSAQVALHHQAARAGVDLSDLAAFADAGRGFIAAPTGQVRDADGQVVWDYDAFAFVKGDAPTTVNPSLWRQALLNNRTGLFKVAEGIWQLRGFDLANISLIQGKTGWIVVDTATSRETAAAAMAFARKHLGEQKVSAVVFTHSHADHFGGALGVLSAEEARARQVPVVAPAGFIDEATSENILMGIAMARRAGMMYGSALARDATGLVDNGLGKAVGFGKMGILAPTLLIDRPQQELLLDGVRFVFHSVPDSEAPAEFTFSLPELRAYCGAELMSHTLHNLYTLRGAKVRDASKWANYLDDAIVDAADAEVVFNQHHWPVWGRERIRDFIGKQRDIYAFIHDQTVRQMNLGLGPAEIAETLRLPKALQQHLNVRGYYGTVRHNVKAVYQFYLGWFDAHPSNLDPLAPVDAARRYTALAGGADKLQAAAQLAFDAGEFRWAAELLKHAVFADAKNTAAKELLARTFEQLGYAAESASWRNFYLSGAHELRRGPPQTGLAPANALDMMEQTPIARFLEAMATRLDAEKAGDARFTINLVFSDLKQSYVLRVENAVLRFRQAPAQRDADATLTLTKAFFLKMVTGQAGAGELLLSDQTRIEGNKITLGRFFALLDQPQGNFPVLTRAAR